MPAELAVTLPDRLAVTTLRACIGNGQQLLGDVAAMPLQIRSEVATAGGTVIAVERLELADEVVEQAVHSRVDDARFELFHRAVAGFHDRSGDSALRGDFVVDQSSHVGDDGRTPAVVEQDLFQGVSHEIPILCRVPMSQCDRAYPLHRVERGTATALA